MAMRSLSGLAPERRRRSAVRGDRGVASGRHRRLVVGNRLTSRTIEQVPVRQLRYGRSFGSSPVQGHGIGRQVHMDPFLNEVRRGARSAAGCRLGAVSNRC